MKKTLLALLTIIIALTSSGAVRAEIRTILLSDNTDRQFTISADNDPKALTFSIGPGIRDGDTVTDCKLRVVPTPQPTPPRADQDVAVFWSGKKVGQWSAYSRTTEPYTAELMPEACAPGPKVFTLRTETKFSQWEYYGGTAVTKANQPRLIVTYDSPNPAHSGESTDRAYEEPASFFSTPLLPLSGGQLLANPVSYAGAVYVVVGFSDTRALYRLAGSEKNPPRRLGFEVDKGSFASVTAWGCLQLITTNAIRSCSLSADKSVCDAAPPDEITVNPGETPAVGPDGSLYFKNVKAQGSIVAYNPSLRELWRTELKLTTASPIALSANGRYAYVLADIANDARVGTTKTIALLRIDTATGETVSKEITYKDEKRTEVKPTLLTLLRPAVASKVINNRVIDYVFAAGNTSDTGILQLVAFDQSAKPEVVWSRRGKKITAAPVLSVKDGNSLFVAQDGMLKRYLWFSTKEGSAGAYPDSAMKVEQLTGGPPSVTTLLVDGSDSVYMYADTSLYVYRSASKTMPPGQKLGFDPKLLFTPDGVLIGYDNSQVYDLSPKAVKNPSGRHTNDSER